MLSAVPVAVCITLGKQKGRRPDFVEDAHGNEHTLRYRSASPALCPGEGLHMNI